MSAESKSENYIAFFNILSTVIVAGVSFFTIPVFTRILSTDAYGVVSIYEAWTQIFIIFIGLKVDGSIASASANLNDEEQDSYQFSVLMLSVLSFTVLFTICCIFLNGVSGLLGMSPLLVLLLLLQSFGAFVVQFFNMRFVFSKEARNNFFMAVGISVATTVLSILLILFVFSADMGPVGRAIGLTVPNLLLGLSLIVALRHAGHAEFDKKYWTFCLSLSLPLVFHGLSQQVLSQCGKISVQQFNGDSAAGIFGLAITIASLITYIYTALNNAFVPFMYEDLAGKTSEEIKQRHFGNYLHLFTLGSMAFSLMAPEVLMLMSTEAFYGALDFLPLLLIGKYCVFLYSFPVNYEFFKMQTKSIAIGTVLAAGINIALCVALVPSLGAMGAAIASLVAYLGLFLFHLCIARFVLGDRNYPVSKLFIGLASVSVVSLAYYPLADFAFMRWGIGFCLLAVAVARIFKTRTIF